MSKGPGVLFAPEAHAAIRQGMDRLANLVRPTLGPTPRCVAIEHSITGHAPEVLDHAATILRRVIQLPNPYVDMGAMLLRHAVWQTAETAGDGSATTAVLLQAIVHHASRYLEAGGDPVALRRGLNRGQVAVVEALSALARPLGGRAAIERSAVALGHDPELAGLLGEILDIVGADGHIHVETGQTRESHRQYVDGVFWYEGYLSPYFVTDEIRQEARLEEPAILISDLRLTTDADILPLLERISRAGIRNLMIVAREVSGSALGLLVANHQAGTLRTVAVKTPTAGNQDAAILEDLAVFTGGRAIVEAAGARAREVKLSDLGYARVAWATNRAFGLRSGKGDPVALRRRIGEIKAELAAATDATARENFRARLGKLMGGSAVLQIGGATRGEMDARLDQAKRTITTLRHGLTDGVVPGGGRALLLCRQALRNIDLPPDEQAGVRALMRALEEPLKVIVGNAGYDPATVLDEVMRSGPECGFDARSGAMVNLWDAGILDSARVLQTVLEAAVSGATMVLTTNVLIHRRKPPEVVNP